jgi:hypothetical protein
VAANNWRYKEYTGMLFFTNESDLNTDKDKKMIGMRISSNNIDAVKRYIMSEHIKYNSDLMVYEYINGEEMPDGEYRHYFGQKNSILFVNGYRFYFPEKGPTNNQITQNDRFNYWEEIDEKFIDRRKSKRNSYAVGHMSITTSNHGDMVKFVCSARSTIEGWPEDNTEKALKYLPGALTVIFGSLTIVIDVTVDATCIIKQDGSSTLNTVPNKEGFEIRKNEGRKAGMELINKLKQDTFTKYDTLDIVCHSMGFAYSLGMIEELKRAKINFGGFYIIAPENASSGTVNVNDFTEVWQYGSDENLPEHKQDGVAPQRPVGNLYDIPNKSGRAYIPDDEPQGFISSHSIGNYKWIFEKLNIKDNGYVTPRK